MPSQHKGSRLSKWRESGEWLGVTDVARGMSRCGASAIPTGGVRQPDDAGAAGLARLDAEQAAPPAQTPPEPVSYEVGNRKER